MNVAELYIKDSSKCWNRSRSPPHPTPNWVQGTFMMLYKSAFHILKIKIWKWRCRPPKVHYKCMLGSRDRFKGYIKGQVGFHWLPWSHLMASLAVPLTCNSLAAAWDWSRQIFVSLWPKRPVQVSRLVRYHCGGWSEEVNSCILILSYMVYL
jgi:hypothetical protein